MAERIDVHMRQSDAFAWYMEDDPLLRSTVVIAVLLDANPDFDRFLALMDHASRVIPSFRQKVVMAPMRLAPPRWTYDADFDLSFHVRRVRAPEPRTLDSVLEYAKNTAMAGFDRARPLWVFTVMEDLDDDTCGARAAVVLKIHHSLSDGIGAFQMGMQIFDFTPEPTDRGPTPEAPEGEVLSQGDLFRDAVAYDMAQVYETARNAAGKALPTALQTVRHPFQAAVEAMRTAASIGKFVAPASQTLSHVMTGRRLASHFETLDVPLADLKKAAKAADGKLNDAFMAGLLGGLRIYHEHHGAPANELRVTLPISVRADEDAPGGNRITLVRFALPVDIEDPKDRMRSVNALTQAWRHEPSIPYSNMIAGALNLLPNGYVGAMLKHVDFLASNVPGLPVPVWLAGAKLLRYYAFGPTIGASVNVTLASYCDVCCVGVNMDTGAVPDADVFMECLQAGFDEVLALAD